MNRRDFLKMVGLAAAGLATATLLPVGVAYPKFDPRKSYGDFITATDEVPADVWIRHLDHQIAQHIPLDYRSQIEYRSYAPPRSEDPLMQTHCYAWKYTPEVV